VASNAGVGLGEAGSSTACAIEDVGYRVSLANAPVPPRIQNAAGEYVFDHGWASAFARQGRRYYPKLQCCVPFTPATGSRLLLREGPPAAAVRKAAAKVLMDIAGERHRTD
jgi:uncharacterized protein